MRIEELLHYFHNVKEKGTNQFGNPQYMASCPCSRHKRGDQHPSLGISENDCGRIMLNCFGNCPEDEILSAVNLTEKDLWINPTARETFDQVLPKWQQGLEAVYDYYDDGGQYAYSKLRYQGKKIFYGFIDRNGCRYKDITKERYLYNAQELKNALALGLPVYYAEGEKDVETLRKLGLPAVTAGGTSDWKSRFAEKFSGAWVTILADNDEAGQKLARRVAKDIKDICYCHRIVTPSDVEKGDVTDYIEEGHSKEELLQLIDGTPWIVKGRKKPKLKNLLAVEDAEIEWLWEPYIQANNLTIFRGDGGVGKTYFICALMSAISNEVSPVTMPGFLRRRGRSIYFGMEDDEATIKRRVKACGGNLANIDLCSDPVSMQDPATLRDLIREARATLVVFDPLQAYIGANLDINKSNEVRPVLEGIRAVAREMNCAVVIIEHQNKMTTQSALYRGVGSIDMVASARSVLASFFHPTNENERVTFQIKTNAKSGRPISWIIEDDGAFSWNGVSIMTLQEVEKITQKATGGKAKEDTAPAVLYVKAIMKEHPEGWRGRAAAIFEEGSKLTGVTLGTPVGIGKQLGDENNVYALQQEGIYLSQSIKKGVREYEMYKNTAENTQCSICPGQY